MENENNNIRTDKLKEASSVLKNLFDYFYIDTDKGEVYKKLSRGNNNLEAENLIEFANEYGINLSKKFYSKDEILLLKPKCFSLIATFPEERQAKYIFIKKGYRFNTIQGK